MTDFDTQRALQKNRIRRRGIYLLPNLFTTAALFAGFYAIVQAMNLRFDQAAVAIFVAMVLDGLDGRVARLTRTQSAFGAEYDSLADMVSFGAAPALIVYEWALKGMGKLGWIAAFVYVAGAALRLARFNTMLEVADKHWFTGIPSPAAAALVAGLVWIIDDYSIDPSTLKWWVWCVTVFAGLTMVSNIPTTASRRSISEECPVSRDLRLRAGDCAAVLISRRLCSSPVSSRMRSGYVALAWKWMAVRRRRGTAPPV
jgi:CDP-diacylglycerol--serine O-phosphatidyltransferase